MTHCDVLVVGGGPAGSSCARALAVSGLEVLVLDGATFPRPKVCAGWVTPQVFATLEIEPQDYAADGRTLQAFTGFRLGVLGGRRVAVHYRRTVSYGVLRTEFDHFLLHRTGARLRLGEPLQSLERVGDRWLANGEISAPVVVGAGGHACPVARHLGARGGTAVAAREVELAAGGRTSAVEGQTPELWFTPDLRGYGWFLRKGEHLNAGLGLEAGQDLNTQTSAFLRLLQERFREELPEASSWRGCTYRLWGRGSARLAWDGALLVGDAAGLAYPQSGEGIRPAVESGLLAARAVVAAGGDHRVERLRPYEKALRSRLGSPGDARGRSTSGLRQALARLLLSSQHLARRFVLDRWFLRRGEPPLLP